MSTEVPLQSAPVSVVGPMAVPASQAAPDQPGSASDAIARMAATLHYADLDAATVQAAKLRVLDVLGCALGGSRATGCEALVQVSAQAGGAAQSTVAAARGLKLPAGTAAMVNAVLARSFDYEVMGVLIEGRLIPSHHAATTVMVALALCESLGLGGRELITALVIGDDVAARALAASGLDFGQGWDGSATYTALGAAATAGHLLGLTPLQMRHAMGLAVDQIGGTIQSLWDGATHFKLGQGTAARNAVFAAQLAQAGWTGMADPLLGRFGFYAQYTAGCTEPAILTRDLGRRFWAEAYFKPYPACMATHVCIEAARAAVQGGRPDAPRIAQVTVRLPAPSLRNFCAKPYEPRLTPHVDAIFSYPHMVARVLLDGHVAQPHYAVDHLHDEALVSLARRIRLEPMAPGGTGAEVEVLLDDGKRLTGSATAPSRSPLVQPASVAEIEDKFRRQVAFSGQLGAARAQELLERVHALESQDGLAPLAALLAGDGAAS